MGRMAELAHQMSLQEEMQQGFAEHQAYVWHCLSQARAGKATDAEWEEIESACGFPRQPMQASPRYLLDSSEDNEPLPF